MIGKKPVFGICMGHQLLGQAFGGATFKLKFGHHGGNHPIRFEETSESLLTHMPPCCAWPTLRLTCVKHLCIRSICVKLGSSAVGQAAGLLLATRTVLPGL